VTVANWQPRGTDGTVPSVYRFLLRPKWVVFHLVVIAAIVAMLNLAQWQWSRHNERRAFNELVGERQRADAQPLGQILAARPAPDDAQWLTATATGRYLDTPRFEVVNRSQNGQPGRNVVDALRLDDGTVLLVNRGFLTAAQDTPPPPPGEVTVTGRVKAPETRKFGQASDDPSAALTEIRRVDLAVLQSQFGQTLQPVFLEQLSAAPPDDTSLSPVPAPELVGGPHLSYTAQWCLFSAAVAVGWVLAVRHSARRASGRSGSTRWGSAVPIDDEPAMAQRGTPPASPP
jgi:surfeit locus 1 family protein